MLSPTPVVDRFWGLVCEIGGPLDTPCWVRSRNPSARDAWSIFTKSDDGRKMFMTASTWAYVHIGRKVIPRGKVLMAMCENGACVNPAHRTPVDKAAVRIANGADGKTGHYGNANPMRKYKGLQSGERSVHCKLSDAMVLWVLSQRGIMTRPAMAAHLGVSRKTIDNILAGHRTTTPADPRATPQSGETGRYSPHGHRGNGTQARGRSAGGGNGQAAAHQDPNRGHGEPHGARALLCRDDRP